MRASDLFYETFSAIHANRGRSLLTVLGIVIGIAAVISMTALIDGVKASLVGELGLDQSRTVMITCYVGRDLTSDDVDALEEGLSDQYDFITGTAYASGDATNGVATASLSIQGVEPEYFQATGVKASAGRLVSEGEASVGARVIVLDRQSADQLWPQGPDAALGQTLRLGNDDFTVVGVTEASLSGGTSYVPLKTAEARLTGSSAITHVVGFAREGADMDSIAATTETYLRRYFNVPDDAVTDGTSSSQYYISVMTMASILQQLDSTMAAFQLLMGAVAGVSLVVGGIGIMNMMLTNVTERIREIGLRKALGARRSDITLQFLLESVMLCLIGGVIGILLGYGGASVLAAVASSSSMMDGMQVTPVITPTAVVLATGICVGIGVLFGFYPAWRASRLDPVESLRYQ